MSLILTSRDARALAVLMLKAEVLAPGSRGGRFYRSELGDVRYGDEPEKRPLRVGDTVYAFGVAVPAKVIGFHLGTEATGDETWAILDRPLHGQTLWLARQLRRAPFGHAGFWHQVTHPFAGGMYAKAQQFTLFGAPEEVKAPGSRGGHYRITKQGKVRYDQPAPTAPPAPTGETMETLCQQCDGQGRVHWASGGSDECAKCGGSGRVRTPVVRHPAAQATKDATDAAIAEAVEGIRQSVRGGKHGNLADAYLTWDLRSGSPLHSEARRAVMAALGLVKDSTGTIVPVGLQGAMTPHRKPPTPQMPTRSAAPAYDAAKQSDAPWVDQPHPVTPDMPTRTGWSNEEVAEAAARAAANRAARRAAAAAPPAAATSTRDYDHAALAEIGKRALTREQLRDTHHLAMFQSSDLQKFGYNITHWLDTKAKGKKQVIEYKPKEPGLPRLTASTEEEADEIHRALRIPVPKPGQKLDDAWREARGEPPKVKRTRKKAPPLRTKSGREIVAPPSGANQGKRMDAWLLDEARAEAVATKNDYIQTILSTLNAKHLSPGDRDTLNEVLFGDARGVWLQGAGRGQVADPEVARLDKQIEALHTIMLQQQDIPGTYGRNNAELAQLEARRAELVGKAVLTRRPWRLVLKASQFTLFGGEDVLAPGSRGGKFYRTDTGRVRYGEKPVEAAPPPAAFDEAVALAVEAIVGDTRDDPDYARRGRDRWNNLSTWRTQHRPSAALLSRIEAGLKQVEEDERHPGSHPPQGVEQLTRWGRRLVENFTHTYWSAKTATTNRTLADWPGLRDAVTELTTGAAQSDAAHAAVVLGAMGEDEMGRAKLKERLREAGGAEVLIGALEAREAAETAQLKAENDARQARIDREKAEYDREALEYAAEKRAEAEKKAAVYARGLRLEGWAHNPAPPVQEGSFLVEHQGELYVRHADYMTDDPVQTVTYYPTGIRAASFKQNYGEDNIGGALSSSNTSGLYTMLDGRQIQLLNMGQTTPRFAETRDVPQPKGRGKKMEWRRDHGMQGWYRDLKTGWSYTPHAYSEQAEQREGYRVHGRRLKTVSPIAEAPVAKSRLPRFILRLFRAA